MTEVKNARHRNDSRPVSAGAAAAAALLVFRAGYDAVWLRVLIQN